MNDGDETSGSDATRPTVLLSMLDDVACITLDRPHRGNAIDNATAVALADLIEETVAEGRARAILLTGHGRNFCTGADISSTKRDPDSPRPPAGHMLRSLGRGPHRAIEVLWSCPLPTVAAVHGRTSGMGLHLALACDFRVSAASATFAEPFSERGFCVDSGGSWLLPRTIGMSRAKTLLYTAAVIDARTALEWGLVDEVCPDDAVRDRADGLARELSAGATFAISTTKSLLHRAESSDLAEALQREAHGVELTIRSDDFKEGMNAFKEKRRPRFIGR